MPRRSARHHRVTVYERPAPVANARSASYDRRVTSDGAVSDEGDLPDSRKAILGPPEAALNPRLELPPGVDRTALTAHPIFTYRPEKARNPMIWPVTVIVVLIALGMSMAFGSFAPFMLSWLFRLAPAWQEWQQYSWCRSAVEITEHGQLEISSWSGLATYNLSEFDELVIERVTVVLSPVILLFNPAMLPTPLRRLLLKRGSRTVGHWLAGDWDNAVVGTPEQEARVDALMAAASGFTRARRG